MSYLASHVRAICRWASLAAYVLSLLILHHVYPMAAKAYDDLCASEGITFGEGYSVRDFGIAIVVFAAPLVLARSRVLIATNLIIALIVTFTASTLLTTAGNIPYECFTSMGTYEDHTSGLEDFTLIAFFATCLAYALLIIDLAIWGIRKLIAPEPKAQ